MIFVRDKGQMCNNIIQYANFYAWAKEHNRRCVSMRFAYKYQYFRICHTPWHNVFMYLAAKTLAKLHLLPIAEYRYDNCTEVERRILAHRNIIVQGWGIRYYDLLIKYLKEIQSLFDFDDRIRKYADTLLDNGKTTIRIGVHIRRGDYKTFFNGRYFFDDDTYIDYVRKTLSILGDRDVQMFVCSNDPHLNEEYYKKTLPDLEITFSHGNAAEDLCLLSECDYLIGPPSSYTLVAAMYGKAKICWMDKRNHTIAADDYKDFNTAMRTFDNYWFG